LERYGTTVRCALAGILGTAIPKRMMFELDLPDDVADALHDTDMSMKAKEAYVGTELYWEFLTSG
jgi:hypothetical protein